MKNIHSEWVPNAEETQQNTGPSGNVEMENRPIEKETSILNERPLLTDDGSQDYSDTEQERRENASSPVFNYDCARTLVASDGFSKMNNKEEKNDTGIMKEGFYEGYQTNVSSDHETESKIDHETSPIFDEHLINNDAVDHDNDPWIML